MNNIKVEKSVCKSHKCLSCESDLEVRGSRLVNNIGFLIIIAFATSLFYFQDSHQKQFLVAPVCEYFASEKGWDKNDFGKQVLKRSFLDCEDFVPLR